MTDVEVFSIVVIGLVGILAWFRAGKAAKKANGVAKEQVAQSKRIADVQERLEQRERLTGEEGRTHAKKSLRAKLVSIDRWVGDLPENPKAGGWNHHPIAEAELTQLEGLSIASGLDESVDLDVVSECNKLVSATRRLNTVIQVARDRELGRVPAPQGYSSLEIQHWTEDKADVGRIVTTLLGLFLEENPTQETDRI